MSASADLPALVRRLSQALADTPILMVDVRAARLAGEDEVVGYAKQVVQWFPAAKALIAEANASCAADAGQSPGMTNKTPSKQAQL